MGGGDVSEHSSAPRHPIRILVLNPNSSNDMTKGMMAAVDNVELDHGVRITSYTGPSSAPASINNDDDIKASTEAVYNDASTGRLQLGDVDAVLVACYSVHSLVDKLHEFGRFSITGIFEASISTAQLLLRPHSSEMWGIVTTGKFWEDHLTAGVSSFLGQDQGSNNNRFAGVFSTGLNAGDFHTVPPEEVESKLRAATKRLFESGNVKCVVMGCGGMAGLESVIRSTAEELYGSEVAQQLYVVDGVKAGVLQLDQTVRSARLFRN